MKTNFPCPLRRPRNVLTLLSRVMVALWLAAMLVGCGGSSNDSTGDGGSEAVNGSFQRVANFPVFRNTSITTQTVAEIVSATADGMTLVYTDGEGENIGFVDISDPLNPAALGTVPVGGEPTSVAVLGNAYALAAVDTSPDFDNPSGVLIVIDVASQAAVREIALGGQPDAVAISPDGEYAAIAIENERDEDENGGQIPQLPAGFLVVVDLSDSDPANWTTSNVPLTGLAGLRFNSDPEPEYVDINADNLAVITLQENNGLALVDLATGMVSGSFSAGVAGLLQIDSNENDLIELDSSLSDVPREPDGVSWLGSGLFATADEGDLDGGSRGFTIFDTDGSVVFTSGNLLEHKVTRLGHYPEDRSGNKGNEPENVTTGVYGGTGYLFVGSERSSVVFVYRYDGAGDPEFVQTLPSGVEPEGLLTIESRNLFITASEEDSREDGFRSILSIYQFADRDPTYPKVVSADRGDGTPIPWGALSGLALLGGDASAAFGVHDSYYANSRIYGMDLSTAPATINSEIVLNDSDDLLAAVDADFDASLVNADGTVNLDMEGITTRADGGFWVVSEGSGSVDDATRPIESPNLLVQVDAGGNISDVVRLPATTEARQRRHGFEGVAVTGAGENETVYVAFQREWVDDPDNRVRIGRYDVAGASWSFYYYPIETPASANGGWVALADLAALSATEFAVIERDNQAGPDAAIKRLYRFSVGGLTPAADPATGTPAFPLVSKTFVRDLIPVLQDTGGLVLEKLEGLAVDAQGNAYVVNDNDGVDDSNGETQLLRLPSQF